ncbi:hypothetical protein [Paenibacillus roseipurpureus]|uniref:Uncharacterized protein n=1 Tax=Paenibacillus roseopurpureus TaxID=2918901 RepID=A0AA96LTH0_9BACL|nr:hypothetical protein [Paenibacillus sp. MBLB1832]WNR45759.1 hypothetical protein MJB10_06565 [Paenibacillus sp. MBLB1832]
MENAILESLKQGKAEEAVSTMRMLCERIILKHACRVVHKKFKESFGYTPSEYLSKEWQKAHGNGLPRAH